MIAEGMFNQMGTSRERFGTQYLGSWAKTQKQSELEKLEQKVDDLQKSVDQLTQFIKFTIGNHALIKGKWVPLDELNGAKIVGVNKKPSTRRCVQGGKQR